MTDEQKSMYIKGTCDGNTVYASKAAMQLFKAMEESEEKHKQIRLKYGLDNTQINPGLTKDNMDDIVTL